MRGVNFNPPLLFFCGSELLAGAALGVTGTLDRRDGGHILALRVSVRDGEKRLLEMGNERQI